MPEAHDPTSAQDPERVERQLRNVRLKLVSARREVQTLLRQAGMRNAEKQMRLQIDRAERRVQELERSEEDLAKLLEPDAELVPDESATDAAEVTGSQSPAREGKATTAESGLTPKESDA